MGGVQGAHLDAAGKAGRDLAERLRGSGDYLTILPLFLLHLWGQGPGH